jgi:hypothetical protein
MRTIRIRVTLREVVPRVTRIIDVPAGVLLSEVHDLLQVAVGWTDSHLHIFQAGDVRFAPPGPDGPDPDGDGERDEHGVRLRELPASLMYLYDFGDGWEHELEVLGPGGPALGCVSGEGACPPEDVGGPGGYEEFRAAIADPDDPEH